MKSKKKKLKKKRKEKSKIKNINNFSLCIKKEMIIVIIFY